MKIGGKKLVGKPRNRCDRCIGETGDDGSEELEENSTG